jgi:hypothetical protein
MARGRPPVRSFSFLVLATLIRAIVVAPLDEARAHPFTGMALKSESIAPLDKVVTSENIVVIGAAPNKDWWLVADRH